MRIFTHMNESTQLCSSFVNILCDQIFSRKSRPGIFVRRAGGEVSLVTTTYARKASVYITEGVATTAHIGFGVKLQGVPPSR